METRKIQNLGGEGGLGGFHGDFGAAGCAEDSRGAALIDGDFEKAARSDYADRLARAALREGGHDPATCPEPTRIVSFPSAAASAGTSAIVRFVIKLPKRSTRSTTPFIAFPALFGLGRANRVKSVMGSPKLAVCQDLESQAAQGAKISRP